MANKEVSGLTAGTTLDGTELFHGVQSSNSRKFTGAQIATLGADPVSDDGDALGTAAKRWSDLFFAFGAVTNYDNGDVLVTHSANTLTWTGATSGYHFDTSLFLTEQAAALADVAGRGQFWVLTATPNLPRFTDDAGTDFALKTSGRETHPIPAADWCPTITNGCGRSYTELATNDLISDTLDFDATTQQFATAVWCPPKKYNGGTITFRVKHRMPNSATTETVNYALSGAFIRNNDAADATLGTPVVVTDTWLADENEHVSPESTAVTLGGTYAEGCKVALKLQRNVASDNAAGDTLVEAVEIFWTSNAGTDT